MQVNWEPVLAWCAEKRGRVAGAAIGLLVGAALLILGFWRGLFLTACVWVGWVVGGATRRTREPFGSD